MRELEDHSWFPTWLRIEQSEFIGNMAVASGIFKPLIQRFKARNFHSGSMMDLCAGSGIPAQYIFQQSGQFQSLVLSDKFPVKCLFEDKRIQYLASSCDVLNMHFDPHYCYTMLNAFHHFSADEQNKIIKKCESSGAELYIIEILEPSFICLLKVILAGTLGVIFLSPFIGSMSWKKFLLTYIIPLNILTITIDGIISVFKSKTRKQFQVQLTSFSKHTEVYRLSSLAGPTTIIHVKHAY